MNMLIAPFITYLAILTGDMPVLDDVWKIILAVGVPSIGGLLVWIGYLLRAKNLVKHITSGIKNVTGKDEEVDEIFSAILGTSFGKDLKKSWDEGLEFKIDYYKDKIIDIEYRLEMADDMSESLRKKLIQRIKDEEGKLKKLLKEYEKRKRASKDT